jgi:energy-coupling factor transporter ATP-binding protein EcfA2
MSEPPLRLHASAVAIGEAGILIRGPSGSGKSSLALALIAQARAQGRFARLVADDRTEIALRGGRLLACPVPPLAGLVERRGLGLTPEPHLSAAVLRLIVDCGAEPQRMPEPEALVEAICGISLPRLTLRPHPGEERLILAALALFADSA